MKNIKDFVGTSGLKIFKSLKTEKLLVVLLLGIGLRLLNRIPIPWLDGFIGNADKQQSLLAIGILPLVQASILVQLLNVFQKDETFDKSQKIQKQTKQITVICAFIASITQVKSLISILINPSISNLFFLGFSFFVGALIIVWLSDWISEIFSISGSIVVLSFTTIFDDIINSISKAWELPIFSRSIIIFYYFLILLFSITLSRSTINFPIRSSKQAYSQQDQATSLSFSRNPGAVMALISTEYILSFASSNISIFNFQLLPPVVQFLIPFTCRFFLIIIFNYYCSKIQMDTNKVAKDLANMNITVLNKPNQIPIQNYLDDELKKNYLQTGLRLAFLVALSDIIGLYNPSLNLRLGLNSLLICSTTFIDLGERILDFTRVSKTTKNVFE